MKMNRITLESMLSFNEIYHYKETSNILLYNSKSINVTIPCDCSYYQVYDKIFITFRCRVFLTKGIFKYIKSSELPIYINGLEFYIGNNIKNNCEVGEPVICKFDLIAKDGLGIEKWKEGYN